MSWRFWNVGHSVLSCIAMRCGATKKKMLWFFESSRNTKRKAAKLFPRHLDKPSTYRPFHPAERFILLLFLCLTTWIGYDCSCISCLKIWNSCWFILDFSSSSCLVATYCLRQSLWIWLKDLISALIVLWFVNANNHFFNCWRSLERTVVKPCCRSALD